LKLVLFDSDVLLDVLAQRQPFVIASAQALNTVTQEQVQGYVSGHAVTNIFYILRRQVGSKAAR
jgi:predicted nucleic-acid-binding protein